MIETEAKGIKAKEINKILGFVLTIPASSADIERMLLLMNSKWSYEENDTD